MSDKTRDFEHWFKKYMACARCGNDTSIRYAASNAWYAQETRIKELEGENKNIKELLHDLDAILKTALHNGHHDLIQRVSEACKFSDSPKVFS
jgi:hypothetical protein